MTTIFHMGTNGDDLDAANNMVFMDTLGELQNSTFDLLETPRMSDRFVRRGLVH